MLSYPPKGCQVLRRLPECQRAKEVELTTSQGCVSCWGIGESSCSAKWGTSHAVGASLLQFFPLWAETRHQAVWTDHSSFHSGYYKKPEDQSDALKLAWSTVFKTRISFKPLYPSNWKIWGFIVYLPLKTILLVFILWWEDHYIIHIASVSYYYRLRKKKLIFFHFKPALTL